MAGPMHYFDADIAEQYGIQRAVIMQNILNWLHFNKKNNSNIIEYNGKCYVWTYMTAGQIAGQMRYFSERVIQRKLSELVSEGALIRAKLSKNTTNHTYYYTTPDFEVAPNLHDRFVKTVESEMPRPGLRNYMNKNENLEENPNRQNCRIESTKMTNLSSNINNINNNTLAGSAVSTLDATQPLQRAIDHNFRFKGIVDSKTISAIWFDFVEHAKLHYTSCSLDQLLAKLNGWISNSRQHLQNQKNLYKKGIGNGASNRKQNAGISAVERRYRANGGTGDPDRDLENLPDW